MGLTIRARRVQQIFEALLVGCIIVILIFLIMRASLRSETVPKITVCSDTEVETRAYASNGFAQRLFQYYFEDRISDQDDFVFCPSSFYEILLKLGWVARRYSRAQLKKAAQLPCEFSLEVISHNASTTDYFVMITDWRKRLDEYFLSAIDVKREEILPDRHKFHETVSSMDDSNSAVLSTNEISFQCQYEDLDFAFASRLALGVGVGEDENSSDAYTVITTKGRILDVPDSCTRVLEIPTTVDNMILVFLAARPSGRCDFARVLRDLRTKHLNEPLETNRTDDVYIRFNPLMMRTKYRMSAPLQMFNAIRIFYKDQAQFDGLITPSSAGVAVRYVDHETNVALSTNAFYHADYPGDNPELQQVEDVLIDIRGQAHLFVLLRGEQHQEAVLFGRRIA